MRFSAQTQSQQSLGGFRCGGGGGGGGGVVQQAEGPAELNHVNSIRVKMINCSENPESLTWPSRKNHSGMGLSAHQPSPGLAGCHPSHRPPLRRHVSPAPGGGAESPAAAAPAAAPPGSAGDPAPEPARSRWTT